MNFFRHRPLALPALALLIIATGCSSADDSASVTVPEPDGTAMKLCRNLHKALPAKVDGLGRDDPGPRSALTAGWGSPAIILRCGVERPPKMTDPKVALGSDPKAVGGEVNGVGWLMEREDGGSSRFTTSSRLAYVEVTVPSGRDTSGVLVDLAAAIKKTVPEGLAN
ncbi:DUF3515 domain-containing protein [Streptomyces graminilatus]|uniref:DUF3515 domain-containing protein n=1 Tax=Streptomyces graminilatus TaxID=1464070 RepID=UPI0006E316F5|nr:DUF3515 domain-containing protein [Streptomyces graminilatus]